MSAEGKHGSEKPKRPAEVDSAGVYFMSIEEFEGRPIKRKNGVRTGVPGEEKPGDLVEEVPARP